MPAKRRQSKIVLSNTKHVEKEDSLTLPLTGDTTTLGAALIKSAKSTSLIKLTKLLAHGDCPNFINHKDKVISLCSTFYFNICINQF